MGEKKCKEPVFSSSEQIDLIRGLNFYSENYTWEESKKWALEWLREKNPSLAQELNRLDSACFSNRGFVCRMNRLGFQLTEEMERGLLEFFKNLARKGKK